MRDVFNDSTLSLKFSLESFTKMKPLKTIAWNTKNILSTLRTGGQVKPYRKFFSKTFWYTTQKPHKILKEIIPYLILKSLKELLESGMKEGVWHHQRSCNTHLNEKAPLSVELFFFSLSIFCFSYFRAFRRGMYGGKPQNDAESSLVSDSRVLYDIND